MARGVIPVYKLSHLTLLTTSGTTLETTGNTTNGHVVANNGATILQLRNITSGAPTATVLPPLGWDGNLTISGRVFTLAASATGLTSTFPVDLYGSTLQIDVSSTNVRIVALSLI